MPNANFVKRPDGWQVWMEFWQDFDYPPSNKYIDTLLPINELSVSGVHGTSWRGLADNDTRSVESKDTLLKLQDQYNKRGIELVPHNIPWGILATIDVESQLAIDMLDCVPKLIIDFELGPEFWHKPDPDYQPDPDLPNYHPNQYIYDDYTTVAPYMEAIRAAHPEAWIGIILDPTSGATAAKYAYWHPYVDAVYMGVNVGPLSNYGATGNPDMDPEPVIAALRAGADLYAPGKERWSIIDPMDPNPGRFERTLTLCEEYGINISVWRRGIVTANNWDVLRNHKKNAYPSWQ